MTTPPRKWPTDRLRYWARYTMFVNHDASLLAKAVALGVDQAFWGWDELKYWITGRKI
jgi:hypothetical protein